MMVSSVSSLTTRSLDRYTTDSGGSVSEEITIVLEDQDTLNKVCGIHHGNLRVIEEHFGSPVFCRGNELTLKTPDRDQQELFTSLIDLLRGTINDGQLPDNDLVTSLLGSLEGGGTEDVRYLTDISIQIPRGSRIFPRSVRQAAYIESMNSHDVIFSIGPAGTGKTFLAVAFALQEVLQKSKKKLILTRPVVEAGESLGFLPGDLGQKIQPYLRPLYDAMDALIPVEMINRLEESRIIEIAPLAYMRGRSLKNSLIILDEAQNTTKEQMKMFLTRIGEGSKAVITGDITQVDLPSRITSGLIHARRVLESLEDIPFTFLDARDVVRHPIVKKIVQAYEKEES